MLMFVIKKTSNETHLTKFRCKDTRILIHAQKIMLQNIPLMFHCNKCDILCNNIAIYKCFISALRRQMSEVIFIALGEIAGAGET